MVISIIALLIGILLPALGAARAAGRSAVCKSNLRQQGIAVNSYAADFQDFVPVGSYAVGGSTITVWDLFVDEGYMDAPANQEFRPGGVPGAALQPGIAASGFYCPGAETQISGANFFGAVPGFQPNVTDSPAHLVGRRSFNNVTATNRFF